MGLNVSLVRLLGAPDSITCPKCKETIFTHFDDYDIEYGNLHAIRETLHLHIYCSECEAELTLPLEIIPGKPKEKE